MSELLNGSGDPIAGAGAVTLRKRMVKSGYWPCCINCINHSYRTTIKTKDPSTKVVEFICSKFQAVPPPEVIAVGCEHHEPDIPF